MVIDGLEGRAVGGLAAYEPFGATVVYLPFGMPIFNRPLDIGRVESALSETPLCVLGPNETLDLHGQSLCGGGRLGIGKSLVRLGGLTGAPPKRLG